MAEQNKKREIELLAPAGSFETFEAVIRAGADAVYLGGSRFGARAYANNFTEEELLRAIDFAHIHGRAVYLTVNTLFKEQELNRELYEYLLPYYKQGLDAVILQDMGAFAMIRREFPGMEIHTSTQMTVTGVSGAAYMKELGASRVVTAREMSLEEIRQIRDNVDVEIESFVHGALCYCYSGQCLLSSMLGGRSGNRGRCAQPCRLPYEVYDKNRQRVQTKGDFILSPKDLCTIEYIPQLSENGVYSFKIEGRMKQAEYAAGVVSVYRESMDRYLAALTKARNERLTEREARARAASQYRVSERDMQKLLAMGNRSGFTDGYYFRHNGKEMITFGKPNHAKANETLQQEIREKYIHPDASGVQLKEKINGILRLKKELPATMEVSCGAVTVTCQGDVVQAALKQPLSREKIETSIRKTGGTAFEFEDLTIDMDEDIFLPVQALNALRREALEMLADVLIRDYRREPEMIGESQDFTTRSLDKTDGFHLSVSVESRNQLDEVISCAFVDDVYLDSSAYDRAGLLSELGEDVARLSRSKKGAYFILPAIFRGKSEAFYQEKAEALMELGLDGVVVKSYDSAAFAKKHLGKLQVILDHSLYSWNGEAKQMFAGLSPVRDTAPLELNKKELLHRDNGNSEIVIYGYLPLMTSAQCVHANAGKCDHCKTVTYLKDRYGKFFPVKNNCEECYNTIYNTTPLALFHVKEDLKKMGMPGVRIAFTIEDDEQVREILALYRSAFLENGDAQLKGDYTNGHYKRGVE